MSKQQQGWKSIWSSAPDIPGGLMADWAQECGIHRYSSLGNQILAGPGWLGVHAKFDCTEEIVLPKCFDITDFITGKCMARGTNRFSVELKRGDTRLFLLG
jgi:hypothetical protein